ncbi:Two-component system response regulator protein [Salinisphaera shabanensis E1L3A]|uniref:Two-component system response regulator protein n=1 Tax=Salinisphaera shabanensis E1L3A TaxID=1033802 RepID=U2FXT1_9GAMM|nr:sigma 54-interacting transcriptional regulator [Salinisphaera shabanensis]ERJ20629.1 Two-component system response regulator protein [Salinisphaera shabanensis E1L3A]
MARGGKILLVDDDPSLRRLLALRLEGAGHKVETADSGMAALRALETYGADCVITDLRMDGMDGMALLDRLSHAHPTLPVILLTAHGTIPEAVAATQGGALDFLSKPVDKDVLLARVDQALEQTGVGSEDWQQIWRSRIVTRSPLMHRLLDEAKLVAASDTSVLITGESGTGKEVLAQALHDASPRSRAPFVAINCGAMPEQLLESELFGHEKGAFTDAKRAQQGLFRSAEGGTVFLDEIGDMPIALQVKLLRVLQEREVRPVGASRSLPVNVRVISATHRDLGRAIEQQSFREDLYYRLAVVTLALPALRERPEDVAPLARHFLETIATRSGRRTRVYSPDAMEALCRHHWPGNIRQLSNVVEQNVALTRGHVISAQAVDKALAGHSGRSDAAASLQPLAEARDAFVRDYLVQLLRITEGNVARGARLAKRNRTEFYKLLNRHAIDPNDYKR